MEPYSELVLEKAMRRRELENTDAVGNAAACISVNAVLTAAPMQFRFRRHSGPCSGVAAGSTRREWSNSILSILPKLGPLRRGYFFRLGGTTIIACPANTLCEG